MQWDNSCLYCETAVCFDACLFEEMSSKQHAQLFLLFFKKNTFPQQKMSFSVSSLEEQFSFLFSHRNHSTPHVVTIWTSGKQCPFFYSSKLWHRKYKSVSNYWQSSVVIQGRLILFLLRPDIILFLPYAGRDPWRVRGSRCGGSPEVGSAPGGVRPAPQHCRTPVSSWRARETTRPSSPPSAGRASRPLAPQSSWAAKSRGRWGPLPKPEETHEGFRLRSTL